MPEINMGIDSIDLINEILDIIANMRLYNLQLQTEMSKNDNATETVELLFRIGDSDGTLARIEKTLLDHRSELMNVKTELKDLYDKSISFSYASIQTDKVIEKISNDAKEMFDEANLMIELMRSKVTDKSFLNELAVLSQKLYHFEELSKDKLGDMKGQEIMEKAKLYAINKIKKYIGEQFGKLNKNVINYNNYQSHLLKTTAHYKFLVTFKPRLAEVILDRHVEMMKFIYSAFVQLYTNNMLDMQYIDKVTEYDLIANENLTMYPFSTGKRKGILTKINARPISTHKNKNKYFNEVLLRSLFYCFVENVSKEYQILTEYFLMRDEKLEKVFKQIMGFSIETVKHISIKILSNDFDSLGIYLCIQIVEKYKTLCNSESIFILDKFWEYFKNILLEKFSTILRLNILSVQNYVLKDGKSDFQPHYIVERFLDYSSSIASIGEDIPDETVDKLVDELQEEVEKCFHRISETFKDKSEKLIYLLNTYELWFNTISKTMPHKEKDIKRFRYSLEETTAEFSNEIIFKHFTDIVSYVREWEDNFKNTRIDELKSMNSRTEGIVRNFNKIWRRCVTNFHSDIMLSFENFHTGENMLALAITRLIHYYYRFFKLLTADVRLQLIPIKCLFDEINQLRRL